MSDNYGAIFYTQYRLYTQKLKIFHFIKLEIIIFTIF